MQRIRFMVWGFGLWVGVCLSGVAAGLGLAQEPRTSESPRNAVDSAFQRKAPDVGERVPNLTAFRADGSKVQLFELGGKPTVLVFGCLT